MRATTLDRMRAATLALLLTTSYAVPALAAADPAAGESYVIENARIVIVSGATIEKGSVAIADGKIVAVGATVAAPAGAKRIDGTGLSVYPGLIDSASQLGLIEVGSISATNDTSEMGDFNPHLRAYEGFNPASEFIPMARINGITTSVSAPTGGVISGQAVITDLDGFTIEQMSVKPAAAMVLKFPTGVGGEFFDFQTFSLKRSSDADARKNRDKKLDEVIALFDRARAYASAVAARKTDASLPPLAVDLKLAALQPVLAGELPIFVAADDFRDVKRAVEFCEKQNVKMILRSDAKFGPFDLAVVAAFLKEKKIPVIFGPMYTLPSEDDDRYDLPQQAPAALAKAGVPFAFASEDSAMVKDLPYQAAMAVAYGGLSKDDALKALTLWPATIWGVADRIGSIEVGKQANLFVTNGDPMEPRTDVKHVFIRGRSIPLTSRQTQLYDAYRNRVP